tara:strand:+ start:263 stop:592 length:330 start_codon:yes stop_codon:yes gene_type:complete
MIQTTNESKNEKMILIPQRSLLWLELGGYIDLYLEYTSEMPTNREAWEMAELNYFNAFQKRRFETYQNFLSSKWQYQFNKLKKHKKTKDEHKNNRDDHSNPPNREKREF